MGCRLRVCAAGGQKRRTPGTGVCAAARHGTFVGLRVGPGNRRIVWADSPVAMRLPIADDPLTPPMTAAGLLGAVLLLTLAVGASEAQELVRFFGSVQWIAGTRMQVMTDSGVSVAVDLTQADQSSYQALRSGDSVVVDGVLSADRRRIVARDLWRESGRGYWTQSP